MCRCYLQQVVFTVCGIESSNTLLVLTENTKNWSLLAAHNTQAVAIGNSCYMATSLGSTDERVITGWGELGELEQYSPSFI